MIILARLTKRSTLPVGYWTQFPCEVNAYFTLLKEFGSEQATDFACLPWDPRETPVERLTNLRNRGGSNK